MKRKCSSKTIFHAAHEYTCAKARTTQDCFEIATVDAYDESEQGVGWLTCLEEVFDRVHEVRFMGELVKIKKFDLQGEATLVAVIQRNGKSAKISLESVEWIKPSRLQALWQRAYLTWQKNSGC